jgi:arylsulfatase A-like enzyme
MQDDKPPNVLIVLWDTVRADRLSIYGYERPTTPRMAAFAEEAAVYEHAWSPGIWTLAAHAAVFTGMPVESTGADERWLWLDGTHTTMAEHFHGNGYDTFSFAANALLASDTNLVQGFRVVFNTWQGRIRERARRLTLAKLIPGDRSNELAPGWRPPDHGATNAEWAKAEYKEAAPVIAEGFLKWLEVRPQPEQPFFAYLNMMEAHTPRIPSMAARKAVIGDDALIQKGLEVDAGHINLHFYNFGKHDYSDGELLAINAVYDATLRDLDDATADLMDELAGRGVLEDTIVVLTSDHGENLGDHHLFNHRFAMHDSLLHVPLLIHYPKGLEPGRHSDPVSTVDLFATLCALTGLQCPESAIASHSLLVPRPEAPVAYMAMPLEREIRTVKAVHPDVEVGPWLRTGHATVIDGHKLVQWQGGHQDVFDLRADPGEAHPLLQDSSATFSQLSGRLDAWRAWVPAYDPATRGPGDQPANVRASQRDLRNQLEALGYIQEDEGEPAADGD